MAVCTSCGKSALVNDSVTGNTVCTSCGIVQEFDNYHEQFGDGGNYATIGKTGSDYDLSYKEIKLYKANGIIEDFTFRLNFADVQAREVKEMVKKVTDGELGLGNWFDVLVGACCYIVMRQKVRVLTINEVCDVSGCELYDMGRMIGRVVEFLGLELPEFDVVGLLERTIRGFSGFEKFDKDKIEVIVKQGTFVVQCCIKWWLTTGRRPAHVAVAVLVFVAGVNGIKVRIDDVAKEFNVGLTTCRLRYRELLEALVEVAKGLPWGEDINVKNFVRNAPCIIKYMEMKSMEDKDKLKSFGRENVDFESKDVVGDLFGGSRFDGEPDDDGGGGGGSGSGCPSGADDLNHLKASHDNLADLYSKFKADFSRRKVVNKNKVHYDDDAQDTFFDEWWSGKSELCEKLLLKELEDTDIGLDTLPPSYIRGCLDVKRRREKIREAKVRINSIRFPSVVEPVSSIIKSSDEPISSIFKSSNESSVAEEVSGQKKRKRKNTKIEKKHDSIDWEDFIIETLLLHNVKEEEIEKGHYKALFGLYVFTGLENNTFNYVDRGGTRL